MSSLALPALAMFGMPGGVEWVVIGIVALLLFGRRLPEIMRGIGSSVREFRSGLEGPTEHDKVGHKPTSVERNSDEHRRD